VKASRLVELAPLTRDESDAEPSLSARRTATSTMPESVTPDWAKVEPTQTQAAQAVMSWRYMAICLLGFEVVVPR
jgi:hypothetical protein